MPELPPPVDTKDFALTLPRRRRRADPPPSPRPRRRAGPEGGKAA